MDTFQCLHPPHCNRAVVLDNCFRVTFFIVFFFFPCAVNCWTPSKKMCSIPCFGLNSLSSKHTASWLANFQNGMRTSLKGWCFMEHAFLRGGCCLVLGRFLTGDERFCIHFCYEVKAAALWKSGAKHYGLASSLTSFGSANSNDLFGLKLLVHQVTSDGMRAQPCPDLAESCWHRAGWQRDGWSVRSGIEWMTRIRPVGA